MPALRAHEIPRIRAAIRVVPRIDLRPCFGAEVYFLGGIRMNCLRCGAVMEDLGREDIQLGQYGFFTGHLSNMLSGSLGVRILRCPECRKIELFADDGENESFSERMRKNISEDK